MMDPKPEKITFCSKMSPFWPSYRGEQWEEEEEETGFRYFSSSCSSLGNVTKSWEHCKLLQEVPGGSRGEADLGRLVVAITQPIRQQEHSHNTGPLAQASYRAEGHPCHLPAHCFDALCQVREVHTTSFIPPKCARVCSPRACITTVPPAPTRVPGDETC